MFFVKVCDPPDGPTSRPLQFRLGPFSRREEAEVIAQRARATRGGTVVCVIESATTPGRAERHTR